MNKITITSPLTKNKEPEIGQLYHKDGYLYILSRLEGQFYMVNLSTGSHYTEPKDVANYEVPRGFKIFNGSANLTTGE